MTERGGFLVFLERTELWKNFLLNELRQIKESSFSVPEIHSIPNFQDAKGLLAQSPCSFVVAEVAPLELPRIISGVVRLKNHFSKTRFAAYAPELMKMSPVEYDMTWELLFQCGFFVVTTSFEELSLLAESAHKHFQALSVPEVNITDQIMNSLPWG